METLNFNAAEYEPSAGPSALPADDYLLKVAEAEMKPGTKDPVNSVVIRLKYEVVDGTYKGRVIYGTINFKNANPQAEEIGRGELSALCHAIGRPHIQTPDQLCGPVFKGKVVVEPPQNGYGEKNAIKKYMLQDGTTPTKGQFTGGAPTGAPGAAPTSAPQTQGAMPAGAPAQQPTTAPLPASPAAPNQPAPVQAPVVETPQQRMLVVDFTYEQYVASGWTEDMLVQHGKMRPAQAASTPAAPAPQASPSAPAPQPEAPAAAAPQVAPTQVATTQGAEVPPWVANDQ